MTIDCVSLIRLHGKCRGLFVHPDDDESRQHERQRKRMEEVAEALTHRRAEGIYKNPSTLDGDQVFAAEKTSSADQDKMFFIIKLVTILLALLAPVHPCRFANCVTNLAKMALVPKSTSVKYVIPIVTEFKTVPSTCFIAVNVTGDCRRRRAFTEKPIIISLDDEDVDIDDILPTLPRSFSIRL